MMTPRGIATVLMLVVASALLSSPSAQQRRTVATVNWLLHNLDLAGSRFSTLDQINTTRT